jgi:Ca-activated chloride channel family protein
MRAASGTERGARVGLGALAIGLLAAGCTSKGPEDASGAIPSATQAAAPATGAEWGVNYRSVHSSAKRPGLPTSNRSGQYHGPPDPDPPATSAAAIFESELMLEEAERDDGTIGADRIRGRVQLDPEEVSSELIEVCRLRHGETAAELFFRFWGDNPFVWTDADPLSTFAVDVDTASYALARRTLREGGLPRKEQVRTEEFVNYFRPDLEPPLEGTFRIETELAPSPFNGDPEAELLRIAVRARDVPRELRQPAAITFVVDTSGSMDRPDRIGLVQRTLRMLVEQLDARDSVAIVRYANEASVLLPVTSAGDRAVIEDAIGSLQANGSTNAEAGLMLGYETAAAGLDELATNRVVLLSDGVANVGETDQDRINASVAEHREAGIYLNTVGVGIGDHNDRFLEQLADRGDGVCNYIDGPREARRALVENFVGAIETVARDVKLQVEFDSARIERFRQIGYENRALAHGSFRDDSVDAGEVGAGHQVEALYEVVRRSDAAPGPLAVVRLRHLAPHGQAGDDGAATELEHLVRDSDRRGGFAGATAGFRRSALVAHWAELLRRSRHAVAVDASALEAQARVLAPELADPDFDELLELLALTVEVTTELDLEPTPLEAAVAELETVRYRQALHEEREEAEDAAAAEVLQARASELEQRIRELVAERARELEAEQAAR